MSGVRLSKGGRIDRTHSITVTFEGRRFKAHPGDTLASALLAGGGGLVARSFKYHRPRGIMSAGVEEANALVHLRDGARHEPNAQTTTVEAFDGLTSTAQNAWPSLAFDIGAVNGLFSRFLGAGFYYKTFIGPFRGTKFWMACEHVIRRAAGMGRATTLSDPDHYEKLNAFCDLLVVGAGPAGIAAALAAGRQGKSVILVEQDFALGGALLTEPTDSPAARWLAEAEAALNALPNIRILSRTTAFGAYDSEVFGLVERVADHLLAPAKAQQRQRYWLVRASRAVLATGAIERPLVFAGNDTPGVMLASSARRFLNRQAVRAGETVVVVTNNDSAYPVALDLAASGAAVTLCDLRPRLPEQLAIQARAAGITLHPGHAVIQASGGKRLAAVRIAPIDRTGKTTAKGHKIRCDLLCVSGGWAPALHLWSQRFGKPQFHPGLDAFLPAAQQGAIHCVGSLRGAADLADCLAQGAAAGAMGAAGDAHPPAPSVDIPDAFWGRDLLPVTVITRPDGTTPGKAFVDLQHDVKLTDIDQAHAEGFVSVEHLKRYTTSGMAADQGKTSHLNALTRLAQLRGMAIPQVGTTTFRPPYTPVAIGALVGHDHGLHFAPTRLSTIHDWHVENGAQMIEAGAWLRPWYYPTPGEDLRTAYIREAGHVRAKVGMVDVSTLGKIQVQGPDAAEFLNRIYANGFKTLEIGRLRYGVMLREDGMVMDDGATARIGTHDYFMSTTTANAAKVLAMAELLLQTAWQDLRVHVTSVTDQWAAIAIAGPQSRALLADVASGDLSKEALPNNHVIQTVIAGTPCRLHRMSYSGELAYEVYIPARSGRRIWEAIHTAGQRHGLRPYGTEAMGALRIEKGHVAGAEIEGRTTLGDLGLEGFASRKKPFVGSVLRNRPVLTDPARPTLVGLKIEGQTGARAGSLLFASGAPVRGHGEGWVSSTTFSPALNCNIALALLAHGPSRKGERVQVVDLVGNLTLTAEVVSHHFFDPEGDRQNG